MQTMQTKKLNRVRLVNWMYFGDETFPIDCGSVLISGENAAGKSTVLDAIQMVLTGNTTKFNKAANENSDRDLKSYVRCKIDTTEKTYLREGLVISNVALEFYEEKERRYFVVGVHVTSGNENETPVKRWYIENGSLDDFSFLVGAEDGSQKPAMADEFRKSEEKIRYIKTVSEYKDNLRHRLGNLEEKFFEVLLKALAFRPVDNVKDFINKYVLTEKNIDVQSLRESIDVLNEFEKTLKKAKLERDELEKIIRRFDEIKENEHNQSVNNLLVKIIEKDVLKNQMEKCDATIKISKQKIKSLVSEREGIETELKNVREKLMKLNQTYESSDYKKYTANLESSIEKLEAEKKDQTERLALLFKYYNELKNFLSLMQELKDIPFSAEDFKVIGENADVSKKAEVIYAAETFVSSEMENVREEKFLLEQERKEISTKLSELDSEIKSLEEKTIHFPAETERLRECIKKEFEEKGIDSPVYVFAELLSITDKSWTNAIEGYLNTQRFYLVVEPEHYNLALEIYKANKKSYSQGIINFRKLPQVEADSNSLAHFVETENRYARRYADYVLGQVICCETLAELENYDSAITKDCMVYKNYVSRKIDPRIYGTPYIGKDAIEVQLKNARTQYKELNEKLPSLRQKIDVHSKVIEKYSAVNFEMIRQNMESPNRLSETENHLEEEKAALEKITKNPDIIQLQNQISEAEKKEGELSRKKDSLVGEERSLSDAINNCETERADLESLLESKNEELVHEQDFNASLYQEANEKYIELSKSRTLEEAKENYNRQKAVYDNRASRLLNGEKTFKGLYQMQGEYNQIFGKDFVSGTEGFDQYKSQFDKLNGVQIVYYEESIRSARDKCEDIFKNEFLSKMKESIESARYEFDNLKKALKDINYGEDTYKFIITPNNQKRNLYNMIMADDNVGGEGLFTSNFESQYKEEIEELFDKIKSGDSSDAAVREYTDYRTYLDYDIEIHKSNGTVQRLSAKAKSSSGGESQVPFYVIMAASLNNIYKSNNCVRLLLLDEAFNNMDEQRISSIMKFFNELQFQTILVAPSPKIQDIEENVDSVLTVMREDTISFVEDFKYYGE